jgi:hypothetical protein
VACLTNHSICACLVVRTLLFWQSYGRFFNNISKLGGFVKPLFQAVKSVPRGFQAYARCRDSEIDYTLRITQPNMCTWRVSCKLRSAVFWHFWPRIREPHTHAPETLHANVSSALTACLGAAIASCTHLLSFCRARCTGSFETCCFCVRVIDRV